MAHGGGGRTIVVSNRGAVTFSRGESGEREYARGAGGLVTALNAVLRRVENAVWIASAQSEEDVAVSKEPAPYEVEDLRIRFVEHDPEAYDLMYNELANPLLWFVQHGLYDLPYSPALGDETKRAWEEGYVPVNRNFAAAVVETAADVLGAEAESGVIRYRGREVWVRAYPISIDPGEFEDLAQSETVLQEEKFVKSLPGKLLLRVDRTDLSKNIVRGFLAYGSMLERPPEIRGEVTFLAQLQPSRTDIREYAAYMEAVATTAEEVNEEFGTGSWRPVELFMEDNFPRSIAAYKHYDVLLVNAVRDGMNLVAKEAAVINEKNGVLVLSENAGAHEELGEYALTVNPYDIDEQADSLYAALTMPVEERGHRAKALRETVDSNTIDKWVEAQIQDIEAYRGRR